MAAAIGVPKRAEKQALIPHIIIILVSLSSKCNILAIKLPKEPPTCRAAPSRPAEPPQRCVSSVDIIIRGATRTGTSALDWIAVITRLVRQQEERIKCKGVGSESLLHIVKLYKIMLR